MYRQSEKNLLSSNTSSTCPDNMVNFGPLTAEIDWRVWGTPSYFIIIIYMSGGHFRYMTKIPGVKTEDKNKNAVWYKSGMSLSEYRVKAPN